MAEPGKASYHPARAAEGTDSSSVAKRPSLASYAVPVDSFTQSRPRHPHRFKALDRRWLA